ncbi:helix-turn-helix domain-containing protein [Fodinicola feengrottensis]|nr:helix-turn-helix domain-containing protein [Fodinicola feengrottensis]
MLTVHVNTLDYRLGRIRMLTSIDPTQREGWLTFGAALTAHRYVNG